MLRYLYSISNGGTVAAVFSAGMATTAAVFQGLSIGDHIIAPNYCYHGPARVLNLPKDERYDDSPEY